MPHSDSARRWTDAAGSNIDNAGQVIEPSLYCLDARRVWLTVPGLMRRFGDVSRSVITKAMKAEVLDVERRPYIRPGTFIALDSAERWISLRRTSSGPISDDGQLSLF